MRNRNIQRPQPRTSVETAFVLLCSSVVLLLPAGHVFSDPPPSGAATILNTVDETFSAGQDNSIVLNSSGHPVISYRDSANDSLNLAVCDDPNCDSAMVTTVDPDFFNGGATSLQLSAAGFPVIAYVSFFEGLRVAVCDDATCSEPGITITPIDASQGVYPLVSLALDSNDFPVISYYDATDSDLKLAVCDDAACTSATVTTVDDGPTTMGFYTSLTLRNNDVPVISYWDVSNTALKLAMCNDSTCSSPPVFKIVDDSSANTGTYSSVALNNSGFPVISYYDESNFALRVAVCNNAACTNPSLNTVDGLVDMVGRHSSLVLNDNGFPVISYYDQTNAALMLAICDDAECISSTPRTIEASVGFDGVMGTSVALNSNGLPVIAYYDADNDDLRLAVCNNADCTAPELTPVDSTGDVGRYASLRLTRDDYPVISYYDQSNHDLKVAVCNDADCTTPTLTRVESSGIVGEHSSMVLNRNGFPVISYYDGVPNADLKVAVMGYQHVFADGFESGNLDEWSAAVP